MAQNLTKRSEKGLLTPDNCVVKKTSSIVQICLADGRSTSRK